MTSRSKKKQRRGKPFTLYLTRDQALELEVISRTRRVAKAELMRLALERLFVDIRGGQLNLPLGVERF